MEELRSTDILDKEIQNDAKKKAAAIIEQGKARAQEILAGAQDQLEKARIQKESFYGQKTAKRQKDSDASIPLEKERFLVSFIGNSIDQAIDDYLKKLSEEEKIALSLKVLDGKESVVKDKKFGARVIGFDQEKAKSAVEKKIGSKLVYCDKAQSQDESQGIVLEAEDKSLKIRLTMQEILGEAKDKHYNEMCSCLFGGRL